MALGERLLQARLEAGLSQRQLCGEEITRNMLSQIEHGTARPSMSTLRYLASRLGKPVSYFLEEDALASPNQTAMKNARAAFDQGNHADTLRALEGYKQPDSVYDRERHLLEALSCLALARQAIREERTLYAIELLERVAEQGKRSGYFTEDLERRRLLLLAQTKQQRFQAVCGALPSIDEELLFRGRAAMEMGDWQRCVQLLEAAEDKEHPEWNLLRGQVHEHYGEFSQAALRYHRAEGTYPEETAVRLERCYRELEDYKQAYFYACKQKQ